MNLIAAMFSLIRLWQAARDRQDEQAMRAYALAFHALIMPTGLEWSREEWST